MSRLMTIDRRSLLKTAALGMAVSTLPFHIAKAQTPKRGGHLVLGVDGASSAQSLDSATFSQSHDQVVGMQLYNTLIELDADGLIPSLAEAWEPSADLKTWTLKLRPQVVFHNGKEFSAADAVYSLNHHRGKDSISAAKPLLTNVESIGAEGKYGLVIRLASPDIDFPYVLSAVHLCMVPEGANFGEGIGTGGYVLESFEPGVRVVTKRNENYFKSDRAFVDSVETLGINDLSARINGLASGELHIINRPDPKMAARIKAIPNVEIYDVPGRGYYTFCMRTIDGPFANNDVRMALKFALDRKDAINKIAGQYGAVGNDHPVSPSDPMFAAGLPQRTFDLDKAAFHFKKSGHTGPLVLSTSDVAFPGANDVAALLKESAAKAGIDITLKNIPGDSFMDTAFGTADCVPLYWNGRPTANLIMTLAYQSTAPWNAGHFKDEQFDQLLVSSRGEADDTKRKQMYHDMQQILNERGSDLSFMFFNVMDAARSNVKGFVPLPHGELSGLRAPEKVWLE